MSTQNAMSMLSRKLITTLFVTALVALAMAFFLIKDELNADAYHLGNGLMAWSLVYFIYVGAIILIYGNIVSIALEYAQKKWFPGNHWLYIVLHGVFGLVNGVFFLNGLLAIFGLAVALLYACIDRWMLFQSVKQRSVKLILLIPIFLYTLSWGALEYISPAEPPFTKEDAVAFATSGDGSVTDVFPAKIGKWQGGIGEYKVTRETAAKKLGNDKYIVTFTETWENDGKTGTWSLAYQVERNSMTALSGTGRYPPYYDDHLQNGVEAN